jgi:hypothetical protein
MPPPLVRWCLQLIVTTFLVAPLPLLILSTIHQLLSANASPLIGLLFTSWLLCHPCCCTTAASYPLNTPHLSLILSTCRLQDEPPPLVCWRLSSHLPLFCQLVLTYYLVAPPPQVSILNPRLHSHWLIVASHLITLLPPIILSSTPPSLDVLATQQLTSRLPLVCPNWLPVCLTWDTQ